MAKNLVRARHDANARGYVIPPAHSLREQRPLRKHIRETVVPSEGPFTLPTGTELIETTNSNDARFTASVFFSTRPTPPAGPRATASRPSQTHRRSIAERSSEALAGSLPDR